MADTVALTIGQYSCAGRKGSNEDSYGIQIPDPHLLETKGVAMVIADGMSGSDAGKEASEMCVKSFLTDYFATSETLAVKTAAGQALSALNRWLYGQGQTLYQSHTGMVSTLSALVLKSACAHIFHVGDSRITRLRAGQFEPLTTDHRVIVSANKNFLSRAMGIDVNLDVDYRRVSAEIGDIYIFTTDGVHDYISNADTVAMLKTLKDGGDDDADAIAQKIVETALKNNSPDNLTCQIVRIDALGVEDQNDFLDKLQSLPFPPPLSEGMILDGYRVVREIHASNRSQVYLCVDEETGLRVALKTPSVNFEDDPVYLQLFIHEEWAGKRIDSPHVLKVLKQTRKRKFLYTVSEYSQGTTLRQWMNDHPAPALDEVRAIVSQIAAGLRAFHRKDMIHQDLKPENILINTDGTVKIIDFGSVKIAGLDEIAVPTDTPELLGTLDYTAPDYHLELLATKSVDIYSLGVIVYEMLTGHLPYGKGIANGRQASKCQYIRAQTYHENIPDWIDGALHKAVECSRARRYDTLSEFLNDLSHPNMKLTARGTRPLLEKNPVAFWRGVSLLLSLVILYLLVRLAAQ